MADKAKLAQQFIEALPHARELALEVVRVEEGFA